MTKTRLIQQNLSDICTYNFLLKTSLQPKSAILCLMLLCSVSSYFSYILIFECSTWISVCAQKVKKHFKIIVCSFLNRKLFQSSQQRVQVDHYDWYPNYKWLKNIAVENREIHCFGYQFFWIAYIYLRSWPLISSGVRL